jgi:hypothetical protein
MGVPPPPEVIATVEPKRIAPTVNPGVPAADRCALRCVGDVSVRRPSPDDRADVDCLKAAL